MNKSRIIFLVIAEVIRYVLKIYLVPIKRSSNVKAYIFGILIGLANVLAYYEDQPEVPPFNALMVTEGLIDFNDKKPTRRGASLIITHGTSRPEFFSCNGGQNRDTDCVPPVDRDKYRGKSGKVWWLVERGFIGSYTKLAQLEVEGKIIVPYMKQKENYEEISIGQKMMVAFVSALILGYIIWMPLWFFSNQNRQFNGD